MKNFRIISLATALVFLFTLVPVRLTADVYVGDGDYSVTDPTIINTSDFEISDNGHLSCYKGTASKVVIPDGVTVIGGDAFALIRYIVNGNGEISENALDINGDGSFNNKDATVLLRWLAGWDVEIY